MFPFCSKEIEDIQQRNLPQVQALQELINIVSKNILQMDMTHIQAQQIVEGDIKHLTNYLQILNELSKIFNPFVEKESPNLPNQISGIKKQKKSEAEPDVTSLISKLTEHDLKNLEKNLQEIGSVDSNNSRYEEYQGKLYFYNLLKKRLQEKKKNQQTKRKQQNEHGVTQQLDHEQVKHALFLKMHKEKERYLKKINQIIYEIENKRVEELQNTQTNFVNDFNHQTEKLIYQIGTDYQQQSAIINQNTKVIKNKRKQVKKQQKDMFKNIHQALQQEKERKLEELKDVWKFEKKKLDSLIKDDGKLEIKILNLQLKKR